MGANVYEPMFPLEHVSSNKSTSGSSVRFSMIYDVSKGTYVQPAYTLPPGYMIPTSSTDNMNVIVSCLFNPNDGLGYCRYNKGMLDHMARIHISSSSASAARDFLFPNQISGYSTVKLNDPAYQPYFEIRNGTLLSDDTPAMFRVNYHSSGPTCRNLSRFRVSMIVATNCPQKLIDVALYGAKTSWDLSFAHMLTGIDASTSSSSKWVSLGRTIHGYDAYLISWIDAGEASYNLTSSSQWICYAPALGVYGGLSSSNYVEIVQCMYEFGRFTAL